MIEKKRTVYCEKCGRIHIKEGNKYEIFYVGCKCGNIIRGEI